MISSSENMAIEYKGIEKAFDSPVLSGIDLSVKSGEMFALFGPSGTGKSVLLKTTLSLIVPDRGDVLINGESVYFGSQDTLTSIREIIGYVFQYAALFDSLSVAENVEMGLSEATIKKMGPEELQERIWESLELVNLDPGEVWAKFPAELRGGMKKRVGIARAIAIRPKYLFYDEPTTGLDPIMTDIINKLILKFQKDYNMTTVIITHETRTIFDVAERVVMLDNGKIVYNGGSEKIKSIETPIIKRFFTGNSELE